MSQTPNQNQENQNIRELEDEHISKLVQDILNNEEKYSEEAKFILFLTRSGKYNYYEDFEIIVGNAKEVVIADYKNKFREYDYYEDVAIIPFTVPVVIDYVEKNGYEGTREEILYIFTGTKWVKVPLLE